VGFLSPHSISLRYRLSNQANSASADFVIFRFFLRISIVLPMACAKYGYSFMYNRVHEVLTENGSYSTQKGTIELITGEA